MCQCSVSETPCETGQVETDRHVIKAGCVETCHCSPMSHTTLHTNTQDTDTLAMHVFTSGHRLISTSRVSV